MNKTNQNIRDNVYNKLIGPIEKFGGVYDADREVFAEFSQTAPIKLLEEILSENIHNYKKIAVKYWRNPDSKEFRKYKK